MKRKQWKMHGVEVLDKGAGIYPVFKEFDLFSFINCSLYCMKNIKWIDQVYLYGRKKESYIIFYTKDQIETDFIIEVMETTIESIKSHLEEAGVKINIETYYDEPEFELIWKLDFIYTGIKILVRPLVSEVLKNATK